MSRLRFATFVLALLGTLPSCTRPEDSLEQCSKGPEGAVQISSPTSKNPPRALADGVAFLLKNQSPDGGWRSDVYATFKEGPALTPLVVYALQAAGDAGGTTDPSVDARRLGALYLAKMATPAGTIDVGESGLDYPAYTAALAVKVLSHPECASFGKARDAWLRYLLERQLTEKLGWQPEDKQYGGWGYCRAIPRKPAPNAIAPPLVESNLSATVFALDALREAKVADAAVYRAAALTLARFQNYDPPIPGALPPLTVRRDGGFFFIYDDPVRNKAGVAEGQAAASAMRFESYGSTTADGLRGLGYLGGTDDSRKQAAAEWLVKNFRAETHPGRYMPTHERNREAVYYYYAASVGRAFRELGIELADGHSWKADLSAALVDRQQTDGSWANPVELVRENDPIVATSNAAIALANCLSGKAR